MSAALIIAGIVFVVSGILLLTGIVKAALTVAKYLFFAALLAIVGLGIAFFVL